MKPIGRTSAFIGIPAGKHPDMRSMIGISDEPYESGF